MTFLSIGDLAHNFQTRRQTTVVKGELQSLSYELASGQKHNLSELQSRDYSALVGLDRRLNAIGAYQTAAKEAGHLAAALQAALGTIESLASDMPTKLIDAAALGNSSTIDAASAEAASRFEAVIAALNTKVAGRYVFSGAKWDGPAVADPSFILSELSVAVSGLTDAASVDAAIDQWFDMPGGGYETLGYTGSQNTISVYGIAEGETVTMSTSAFGTGLRDVIKGHAKAALLQTGLLTADPDERAKFADLAGRAFLSQQTGLTIERAKLGATEARIAQSSESTTAVKHSLEMLRGSIVEADPFETASKLEAARTQLETIYTVTARLSQLSLANYLR
jgi:flagellar hook-associated protein 3 FlgL